MIGNKFKKMNTYIPLLGEALGGSYKNPFIFLNFNDIMDGL